MSTTLSILIILAIAPNTLSDMSSSPLVYKENFFRTDQLCPDLQESLKGKDIDTANYPYKSVFELADHISGTTDPCISESKGPKKQVTTVIIKAVHASNSQWNFTGAQTCQEHIKLRLPHFGRFGQSGEVRRLLCSVIKPPSKDSQVPLYHPSVWQLSRGKMGLSFPMFENVDNLSTKTDQKITNGNLSDKDVHVNSELPRFIQIVFASFYGDSCSLRVQQYLVDPAKEHCNSTSRRFYQLCGVYDCTEEEALLSPIGFWSEALRNQQIQKLVVFFRMKQYHSHEPTLMDFVVGLLRLLVMPLFFLVAYYVTRQFRQRIASRQLLSQLRSMSQVNSSRMGGGARVGSVIIESPVSVRRADRVDDPPPAYDTIISPPSYQEATITAKPETGLRGVESTNSLPSYSTVIIESTNGGAQSSSAGGTDMTTTHTSMLKGYLTTSGSQQRVENDNQ